MAITLVASGTIASLANDTPSTVVSSSSEAGVHVFKYICSGSSASGDEYTMEAYSQFVIPETERLVYTDTVDYDTSDDLGKASVGIPVEAGNTITWKIEWTGNTGNRAFDWALFVMQ